jgi:hypothetical protein
MEGQKMIIIKALICISVLVLSLSNPIQAQDTKNNDNITDDTLVLQSGKKPTPGIHVYDGNGKHLGLLVEIGLSGFIIYSANKIESFIALDKGTGELKRTAGLYFESSDCTGESFASANYMYQVAKAGSIYYTGKREKPLYRSIQSVLNSSAECQSEGGSYASVPAIEVSLQDIGFDIPVTLPFQFKAKIVPLDKYQD